MARHLHVLVYADEFVLCEHIGGQESRVGANVAYGPKNQAILAEMLSERDCASDASTEPEATDRGRHLYIIECSAAPGLVKIGRSSDPARRAAELQAGQWFWVKVLAAFSDAGHLERSIHRALQQYRVTDIPGTEWFRLPYLEALGAVVGAIGAGPVRAG